MTVLLERPVEADVVTEARLLTSLEVLDAVEAQWERYEPVETERELGLRYTGLDRAPAPYRHRLYVLNEADQDGNNFKSNGMRWKVRAALERNPWVETFYIGSAGNAGAALVSAAEAAGKMVVVETPQTLVDSKRALLETALSEVHADHTTVEQAAKAAKRKADEDPTGVHVHPYDDLETIAGQGMIGLRALTSLFERHNAGEIDIYHDQIVFLVQRGGGSLLTGVACAVQFLKQRGHLGDNVQVLEVRPDESTARYDGLNVARPGQYAEAVMGDPAFVQGTVHVSDSDTGRAANRMAHQYKGRRFEPSGLAGVAAFEQLQSTETPTVFVTILSGANVADENYEYFRDAPRRAEETLLRTLGELGVTMDELEAKKYAAPNGSIFHHPYGRHAIKSAT